MRSLLLLLLFGVLLRLSESSFVWMDASKKEEPKKQITANGSRFIVNIVEYQFINNTYEKTPNKFRCIGTLVSESFVVTTAQCASVPIGTHIGVQFETMREDTNQVGYSLTFDNTTVITHHNYTTKDNEMFNIALVKFNSLQVSTDPPLFTIFGPRKLGSIPKVAETCQIIGRNVHLASPAADSVFIIGPNSCYGSGGRQAYCSFIESKDMDVCKVIQGAPVVCKNNEIAGFVLRESKSCIESNGKLQLRYHSLDNFRDWMHYWMYGPATPKPNSADHARLSLGMLIVMLFGYALTMI